MGLTGRADFKPFADTVAGILSEAVEEAAQEMR